jgi:trigger factor
MFPAEYRNATLAGKDTRFVVTVKHVNEPVLPQVNEEFARTLGVADGRVETLRAEVRSNLERELVDRVRRDLRERVFKALLDVNSFEVPKALEESEIQSLIQMTRANLEAQGMPADRVPTDPALYSDQARSRVKLGLILAEMARAKGLRSDPAQVRARVELLAASYDDPKEFIAWHYAKPGRLAQIEAQVLEDRAVELLLETAVVVDRPMSFQELMQSTRSASDGGH